MTIDLEEAEMKAKKIFAQISWIAIILIFASSGFSADKVVKSKWTAQSPVIDGLDNEWVGDEMAVEKKVKVDYAIRNDARSMYVLFVFNDPKYLSNINATGITLYYNTEGKKKKDHAFNFLRNKITGEELIAYLNKRGEVLTEAQLQSIEPTNMYSVYMTERTGKKDEEIAATEPIPGVLNPNFKISQKGDAIIFEFMIPLQKAETSPRGMGVEPGQTFKIGFEWGGMTEALMKRLSAQDGGRDAAASGDYRGTGSVIDSTRGGRSRGGSGGAPTSTSQRMPKKYSFWIDVSLAQNQ
jgi:hypothetical protein